ncbi:hypothetical protein [Mycolicibacterium fortuitum]|uniref:Uncharacterized protein n=2 Tax=Mycolicibacterium fortuitum TaxID=1766 RepID=A0AAE4VJ13_MYCFO|nr:hypothetical protein [Mycolicibacterium fortuitum]MCV7137577.1 hypothetical protein [Mycolicibacterium fortuitum]MDV7195647.1 hypothetical protein [Mycolicibacterium fortuitum]MDV7209322.1 hypothetical protein [Mycolicibacterium fortuitum]MDV7231160.1 hypothetical protein [Mycolicibacterium fortuitum]MDV7262755.1 hypothetical protein [Mycolicibacterium fortuitum]
MGASHNDGAVDLLKMAYDGAKRVQTGFCEPHDDWQPMLLFRTTTGTVHIAAVPLSAGRQEVAAAAITAVLKQRRAVEAVWLSSAWEVVPPPNADWTSITPSQHPDRREILFLLHVGTDFAVARRASIQRHTDTAPRLADLGEAEENVDGLFTTALRQGIS